MDPQSTSEWLSLVRRHETAARLLIDDRDACGELYFHVGTAAECALKAYIMWKERLNAWPEKDIRPDLYTHNLRRLAEIAGIQITTHDPVETAPPSPAMCHPRSSHLSRLVTSKALALGYTKAPPSKIGGRASVVGSVSKARFTPSPRKRPDRNVICPKARPKRRRARRQRSATPISRALIGLGLARLGAGFWRFPSSRPPCRVSPRLPCGLSARL